MKPTIINKNSNFVVITYWWGSGNKNKNTQLPCPEDIEEGDNIEILPKTYDKMIVEWKQSCRKSNCNYMVVEMPEFAQKGMYQKAINFKPSFILQSLKACYPRAVLYIDGDMHIKKYPIIFDMENIDYMAQGWNSDPRYRSYVKENGACYYPYIFETSGGTMYFNNTMPAQMLLKEWIKIVKKYPLKADDRLISQVYNNKKLLLQLNTIQLPLEYLWLSLVYDDLPKNLWNSSNVVITHPACLTGEDRAFEGGASKNRYPPRYDSQITNFLQCRLKNMPFYEYIFFNTKKDVSSMSDWLKFMNNEKLIKKIDYSDKYGDYNSVYDKNVSIMKNIVINQSPNIVYIVSSQNDLILSNKHVLERMTDLIPTIIKYIKAGRNVMYVPNKSTLAMVKRVKILSKSKMSLMCRNKNTNESHYKKEYSLSIDRTYPMFFGHDSSILQHLLYMSEKLSDINKHFTSSFIFPSRIRCQWV